MPKKSTKIAEEKQEEKAEKLSEKEYEKKVIDLSGKGLTAEKIGEELKKSGIHSKEYTKKISMILKEKNMYTSPELINTEKKLKKIVSHLEKNHQDKRAKREKDRIFSQLNKIKRYELRSK